MALTDEKKDLEAGSRLPGIESQYIDEKAGLRNSRVESQGSAARLKVPAFITSTRMPSFRHFLIFFTIFTVFAVTYASAAVVQVRKHHAPTEDEIQFTKLLATISDDPELHDALEQYISSKYHPGTNGAGNTALEFLNNNNAAAATRLVELVKRQNSNGTTTTTTTSITDPPETTTSIVVPPTTSDLPPTTTSDTPTTPGTTETTPEPTDTSTESPPTSTPETPTTPTTPTTTPPVSTPTKSNPTTPSPTVGQETRTSKTQATTYTTVGPDGTTSTITAYTVVPASEPTANAGPTVTPTLQGNAASNFDVIGTVGFGFILFVGLVAVL
ncbi:hypothetical protein V502_03355 [Pseudogymnoascus sp. VKM F-4520 (FW-2644)]|nr:hypothetical protein V502_03355 [Pseudogymnoascus sp. VKM F-4520 (FW-2644)]